MKANWCYFCNVVLFSYDTLMMSCWRADPKERPSFSDLVHTIEFILTKVADYLDINEFPLILDHDKVPLILDHDNEDNTDSTEQNNSMVDVMETPL